jgi:hypothetical protein
MLSFEKLKHKVCKLCTKNPERVWVKRGYIILALSLTVIVFFGVLFMKNRWDYQKKVMLSSTQGGFNYGPSKLWKHRVQLEEIDSVKKCYSGLEVDVVFERGVFDLRYAVNKPSRNNSLEDLFYRLRLDSSMRYWLDFRNLTKENIVEVSDSLVKLLDKYQVTNRVIIESRAPDMLNELSKKGVFTSYWLPYFDVNAKDRWEDVAFEIRECLSKNKVTVISAHYRYHEFIHKYFSDCYVHTWTNGLIGDKDKDEVSSLVEDSLYKVVLVDYTCLNIED